MHSRWRAIARVAIAVAALLPAPRWAAAAAGGAADESATLLRVFLRDGSSLVSYGEPARVGDRIIFSMPTGALPNPPLHLVNLPADTVDWERTDRYANAARAAHYVQNQAELDYAELSNQLAQTLNDVAATTDSSKRLAIVERARKSLAEWPKDHFNYRQSEVKQMVGMLDEAIADLRAAAGVSRFDISLEASTEAPTVTEPLLPPPTAQESIEEALHAASIVDSSVERTSLLSTALAAIDRDRGALPPEWFEKTRSDVTAKIQAELQIDQQYTSMTHSIMALADRRARAADVRGVQRLLAQVQTRDEALGGKRPESVTALIAAVQEKLDAARRLRLARDRWELRLPILRDYGAAIRAPMALFVRLKPNLEDIKALAGSSPAELKSLQDGTARLLELLKAITPPVEISAAHALMVSAVEMAANAVTTRRQATLDNDMNGAWNASSAAAGALMLGTRARTDILALLRPPQPR